MTTTELANRLADMERERLRSLVEVRIADADALHAPDFELVSTSGATWSKEQYLGDIASGHVNYRRFEAVSNIEVMADGDLAVLRYRSLIDIAVQGQEAGELKCWHLDCYRRNDTGSWQVRWSQATSIS
jgi:ketosteroid isomerase-like protein